MICEVWLFAEPIHPSTSRYLVHSQQIEEARGREWLAANGYEVSEPMWCVPCGLLADEEPAHRDHRIARGGDLYGYLRVYEDAPPEVQAEIEANVRQWARERMKEMDP